MPFSMPARAKLSPLALGAALALASPALAASPPPAPPMAVMSYADLADLADSAPIVMRAEVRKTTRIPAARAPGLRPGHARLLVEARTRALLASSTPATETFTYLADVPLDARGKLPSLRKKLVLLFARTVPGRPAELQLIAPDAQVPWDTGMENQLRAILSALAAPGAPGRITGVREAIHVPGTLRGEGETQIFLSTADQSAASITVQHRPGSAPGWGASFSEVMARVGDIPPRDTLAWYRLACFLPNALPQGTNLSETAASRAQAEGDYRLVLGQLGRCPRLRR
jgi:hypothetical protein